MFLIGTILFVTHRNNYDRKEHILTDLLIYRQKKGLTQEKLAAIVGVKRESIARYESGERRPSPDVAERIAQALGMDVATMWAVLYRPSGGSPLSDNIITDKT